MSESPVEIVHMEPIWIAAIEAPYTIPELATLVPKTLGEVWKYLRANPSIRHGRNVAYYRTRDVGLFGVEVTKPFPDESGIVCVQLPGGRGARAEFRGDYRRLGEAHDAIHAWLKAHPEDSPADSCWEIYGHIAPDSATPPFTEVFYPLRAAD